MNSSAFKASAFMLTGREARMASFRNCCREAFCKSLLHLHPARR